MSQTLTADDLTAIKGVILSEFRPMFVEFAEDIKDDILQQTAAGFAEVHEKIDGLTVRVDTLTDSVDRLTVNSDTLTGRVDRLTLNVDSLTVTVNRIDSVQQAEISRLDGMQW